MEFEIDKYGKVFSQIIDIRKLNSLGKGKENKKVKSLINDIDLAVAFSPNRIVNDDFAKACLSALWLHHDFLAESHSISQSIYNQSGSFWHGIMHRREGDYWNSKYWFQRVGSHPIFSKLNSEVNKLKEKETLQAMMDLSEWDPNTFIDLCEQNFRTGTLQEHLCEKIQQLEWQILFDFCYKNAIA